MRILHFTQDMSAGGVEAIICNLLNEMVKGHDVTLGTIYTINKEQVYEQKLDADIKRISLGKTSQGFSAKLLVKLFKFIKYGNYDVVHIHGWFYYFLLPVLFLHKKTTFFYTIHSDAKMENTPIDWKIFKLKRWCFRKKIIHPITISSPSRQSFTDLYRVDSKLIYNGVKRYLGGYSSSNYDYKITDLTKVFIHPARISKEKNQMILVKVFDRLIKEGYDVVLVIAGQIRDKGIFDQLQPYFSNRIKYIGVRSDIPNLMSYAYGFCLPSIWEGLPVTLLEALSTRCIPVCSSVGGIVEVVKNGYNGFLSKSSSEEDYYEVMKVAVDIDEVTSLQIANNSLNSFEHFNIINTAKNYIEYYKEIIGLEL